MADVTARMLALLSTLQSGRSFSSAELTRRLDVSPRTLRRDVDRLRGYGYPVETQPGPGGYYRLAAGRTLPPLVLDDDEALATLLALAGLAGLSASVEGGIDDAALRAYGKLDQFLPAHLRGRAVSLRSSLETSPQAAPRVTAAQLGTLAEAIVQSETISFAYENASGERSIRRGEPYRQVQHLLRWYLLAWDLDRADWRTFRVDRISDERRTHTPYTPRPLPAASATEYLRQGLNKSKQEIELIIDAGLVPVADALKYLDSSVESIDADHTRVVVGLDTWQWLLTNLAFLDADFHIVRAPATFTNGYRTFGQRLLEA
ncbi:WYL domain-containing protein [Kribbella sp. NPDC026611]|uniref:helix-turn-helix transcriptional regulator n=1 Tax=Kribbella sp. NPDC026611 TaxID=3154911 RepID=UPI0033C0C326